MKNIVIFDFRDFKLYQWGCHKFRKHKFPMHSHWFSGTHAALRAMMKAKFVNVKMFLTNTDTL